MNEKPQETREDEQEDILDQIIAQGLEKTRPAAQRSPAAETAPASGQEDGGEAAPPAADKKNRRSAVYLYLLILFGAAFLMLLLAYFVQQRSSETALSDLRNSMNLSREELLDEIGALEKEKGALFKEIDRLSNDLIQWQKRYDEKDLAITVAQNTIDTMTEDLYSWHSFWSLERYYQGGDLQNCAVVLILQEHGQYTYHAPDAARQEEIVRAVINAGILEEEYYLHISDYQELIDAYLAENPGIPEIDLGLNVSRETER